MLDDELIEMLTDGASMTVAELGRANAARLSMWETTVQWFEHHDVLVVPTLPCTAFAADREHPANLDGRPLRDRLLGWLMTYPFNLVPACPVVSVPCGFDDEGLPIGLSIVGRPGHDGDVLSLAHQFEQIRPWRDHAPASALSNH
jgi:aspartyl-tRNA(Asn)/glutamyl-tRNA(Gln) amidotransferase subunit A